MRKLLFIFAFTVVSASQVFGQQKIKDGTSTSENLPNKDALLELESLNKGLLHVRLELKALSDPSPLSEHTAGMMVYNTKNSADVKPGLYYNDGSRWVLLEASGAHEEVVTTLVSNQDGTYTYTSEDGTETIIDIPADVVSNFQTILEDQSVRNAITNLVKQSGGNVHYDGNTFTYVTEEGEIEEITFRDIVRAHETITTLTDNGNGTYTYTNEAGDQMIIDVPSNVVNEFETIIDNGDVRDVLNEYIINNVGGNVSYDGDNFYYVDEAGDLVLIDVVTPVVKDIVNQGDIYEKIVNLIDTLETVTTLVDNGNGTFTYENEEGDNVTFDATRANITENSDGTFTIVDARGNQITIDPVEGVINDLVNQGDIYNEIINLIDGNETVTTLVDNGDGTYTYTNEAGAIAVIDVPAEVINEFETIIHNGDVQDVLNEYIINNVGGNVSYDGDNFYYVDNNGDLIQIDIINDVVENIVNEGDVYDEIINILEAESDELEDLGNGNYKHIAADGTEVEFDVNSVNIEKVVDADGNISYIFKDGDNNAITTIEVTEDVLENIINQGDIYKEIIDLIDTNETVTTLENNGNGIYTYTSEDSTQTVIDVPASVVENFETIVNDGPVEINNETFTTVEDYITHIAENVSNIEGSDLINVTGSGTDTDPYVVSIEEGADNSLLITNDNGDLEWATIEDIVQSAETVTLLEDNGDGTYTYTSEDSTQTVIDVPASVVENFETIVNDGPVEINNETFTTVEDYITHIAENVSNIEGSDLINVTGSGTDVDPYVVSIEEGADNSLLITDSNGDVVWATIENIVQGNETLTILTDYGNGTFTYTDENGDDVTFDATRSAITDNGNGTYTVKDADGNDVIIDIPDDIIHNFETIVQSGPVTVNNETYTTVEEYFQDLIDNNETLTELTYEPSTNQLSFKDEEGTTHNIQLNNTNLSYDDTDQELVYVDSGGNTTTINLNDLVNSNINTGNLTTNAEARINIVDGDDALLHDVYIDINEGNLKLQNIGGTLEVRQIENGGPGQILVTNEGGNGVTWADPLAIAKGSLTSDDIEVTDGTNSILRDVSLEIKEGAITTDKLDDKAVTADKLDGGQGDDDRVGVADADGNITYVTLDSVVKDNETLTLLGYDAATNQITYEDEDGDTTTIDLNVGSVSYEASTNTITYTDAAGTATTLTLNETSLTYNDTTQELVYVNSKGDTETIDLGDLVAANETLTVLSYDDDTNVLTYKDENGDTKTITLSVGSVVYDADDNTITYTDAAGTATTLTLNETSLTYNDTTQELVYVNSKGDTETIDLGDLVAANETLTVLDYDATTNALTYKDENGDIETITLNVGSVVYDASTNTITYTDAAGDETDLVLNETSLVYDATENELTYTNSKGEEQVINIGDLVAANETVTRIEEEEGVYTYYNEEDEPFVIDIPSSVVENFENIYNQIVNEEITVDGDTYNSFEEYITQVINSSTTFEDNDFIEISGDGSATDPYKITIKEGDDNSMLITSEDGDLEWATIEDIVSANETVTILVAGTDGKYTYTSEDSTVTIIDIPASVVENFETIVNEGPVEINGETYTTVEEYLTHVANESVAIGDGDFITVTGDGTAGDPYVVEIKEGDANSMLITNEDGDLEWATIESIVTANETVTRIEEEDGIYTYYNEEDEPFVIDIPSSVVENFENIYNQIVNEGITVDGDTYNSFEEYLTQVINNATSFEDNEFIEVEGDGSETDPYKITIVEGDANSMLITNEDGDLEWATIDDIIKDNETVTTLIENVGGSYTYTNEAGDDVIIDIPASVVDQFENIYNQIVNEEITVNGDLYNSFEEYLTQIVTNNSNFEDNDFITVTGIGTDTDPFKITIVEGAANSMLITNEDGDLEWATIEDIVAANETVTEIEDHGDGTYTYTNEEGDTYEINVPESVVNQFEEIYNDIVNEEIEIGGDTYNSFEEYLENIVNNLSHIEGGDLVTVTGSGTDTDPYVVSIHEGAENSMLITNEYGELEWVTIDSIVNDNIDAKNLTAADDSDNPSGNTTIEIVEGGENAVLVETSIRVKEESITTDHIQNGTIQPEDIAEADKNQVLGTDEDGKPVWKKEAPRFFYMPAVIFNTKNTGTNLTRDLYQDYVNQFQGVNPYDIAHGANSAGNNETSMPYDGGIISSDSNQPTIEVFENDELIYYVTYYDTEVFHIHGISPEGILTYDIIGNATPSAYMNIVFVIK